MKPFLLLIAFCLVCLMAKTAGGHSAKPFNNNPGHATPNNGCTLIQDDSNVIEARTDVSLNSIWDGKLLLL